MGTSIVERRRAIVERAEAAGLGHDHRVHRQRRGWVVHGGEAVVGMLLIVGVVTPVNPPETIPFVLIIALALVACWASWVYLRPPKRTTTRR
jgi:uncharacterized membrane protein YphA (DoxX/SURF4 family)